MEINSIIKAVCVSGVGMICFAFATASALMAGAFLRQHLLADINIDKWDAALAFGGCFTIAIAGVMLGVSITTKGLLWILNNWMK